MTQHKALNLLKGALTDLGSERLSEISRDRDEVLARYGEVFSPENLSTLSAENVRSFLRFENNLHWKGIERHGQRITSDMPRLRAALAALLDESRSIDERLRELRPPEGDPKIRWLGRAVITPILLVVYPDQYGVLNSATEEGLKKIGLWPNLPSDDLATSYPTVNQILQQLAEQLDVDLWTLDTLWPGVRDRRWEVPNGENLPKLAPLLVEAASLYPSYRDRGSPAPVDSDHPAFRVVTEDLPVAVRQIIGKGRPYEVIGSTGRGNVTPAPWIAILDTVVTDSAQEGFYVAYLYSTDLERIYGALMLGVRRFYRAHGRNQRMLDQLDTTRRRLAHQISVPEQFSEGQIDLAAERPTSLHGMYEHSTIVSVQYATAELPTEETLRSDLMELLRLYDVLRTEEGRDLDEVGAVESVDEKLDQHPEILEFSPIEKGASSGEGGSRNGGRSRRSKASRRVGRKGEEIVRDYEYRRLTEVGRLDLAEGIRWLDDEGEYPGYDILSFNEDGTERWIEVKASVGNQTRTVDITENERRCAASAPPGRYWLYLVNHVFRRKPKITPIYDPVQRLTWDDQNPRPITWTLYLR